jgi:hypothetical protein
MTTSLRTMGVAPPASGGAAIMRKTAQQSGFRIKASAG